MIGMAFTIATRYRLTVATVCLVASCTASLRGVEQTPDVLGLKHLERTVMSRYDQLAGDSTSSSRQFIVRPEESATAVPAEERSAVRQQLLDWVGDYELWQELFLTEDVAALRNALLTMPEDQLQQWANDTDVLRERLSEESWLATRQWLHDFLTVQAIYSPEDVTDLRTRFAALPAIELARVVDHFTLVYVGRLRARMAGEYARVRNPQRRRSTSISQRPAVASTGGFYPTTRYARSKRDYGWNYNRSISRQIAAIAVRRQLFGRGWWFLW